MNKNDIKSDKQVFYNFVLDGYSLARIINMIDGRLSKLQNGFGNWTANYRRHEINTLINCKKQLMLNLKEI